MKGKYSSLPWLSLLFIAGSLTYALGQTASAPPDQTKDWKTRTVKGQELISPDWPKARLKFDAAFKYIGTTDFILTPFESTKRTNLFSIKKPGIGVRTHPVR